MNLRFPLAEVLHWANRYSYPRSDVDLLANVGPAIVRQGYFTKDQLRAICRWKTPRSAPDIEDNDADFVKEVSSFALGSTNERVRIEALTLLQGVRYPVASTLLHFGKSADYPIIDIHALWSLQRPTPPHRLGFAIWQEYVEACRELAGKAGVSVRTLDKALWQYSSEHPE
jgi:hypothetical protein